MSRRHNAAVFPLHPGKEEHKRERKWGLCAFNEIVFCIQRGFQLLWGRWKALLATLKCLVLPAFGSMRGARTKYTTVQCKLSGKKLIQHRAIRTTGKQGGVDGLPCRSALSFLLEESCSRWRSGTRAAQRKVRGQQVSEGSNNLEKLLFQCGREWTGSSCKQGACTFGRFSPLVAGSSSVLRAGRGGSVWAPPGSDYGSPSFCSPLPGAELLLRGFQGGTEPGEPKGSPTSRKFEKLLTRPASSSYQGDCIT